jgi:cytidyltransferase-like protein
MTKALIIGRFQPFHKGHLWMYEQVAAEFDDIIIGLVARKHNVINSDNPFSWRQRLAFIKKAIPDSQVKKCGGLYIPKLNEAFPDRIVVVGGERRGDADRQSSHYFGVKRKDGISATAVRDSLKIGDRNLFETLMPAQLHCNYEKMRKIILNANNNNYHNSFVRRGFDTNSICKHGVTKI